MINARAIATLGIGFAARQIAALGLLVESVMVTVKQDTGYLGGGGEPRVMELHKLHILKRRQRDEDALFMLLS
jgi:hypothetical protein